MQGVAAQCLRRLPHTAVGIPPQAGHHHPMLHQQPQQLGIDLTQHPPGLGTAGVGEVAAAFPHLEEQFDLPAHPRHHQHFRPTQALRGHVGTPQCPAGQAQALLAHRLATAPGIGLKVVATAVGHLRGHAGGDEAGGQPVVHAQADGQVDHGRPVRSQAAVQVQGLPLPVIDLSARHQPRQPIGVLLSDLRQDLQRKIAQVRQPQTPGRHQRVLRGTGAITGPACLQEGSTALPALIVQAHLQFQRSRLSLRGGPTPAALPVRGQGGGQLHLGTIVEIDGRKALQQWYGYGRRGNHVLHGRPQDSLHTLRRLLRKALLQPLGAEGHPQCRCRLDQLLIRGVWVGHPPKDQGLHEFRPTQVGAPSHEAGGPGCTIGRGRQHGSQYLCQVWYRGHREAPLVDAWSGIPRIMPEGLLCVSSLVTRSLDAYGALREAPLQPEALPLFASLLSLPLPDRYPLLTLTPQRQKQKTQEAILAWLLAMAAQQPLRFVMEDLHWADPSALELLGLLIDQAPMARILILLSFRSDFRPPWALRSHLTQLTLNRLGRRQVEAMIESVTGGKTLPAEVLQQVVTKTDGVPLFVEEFTKMVLESDLHVGATHATPSAALVIPATLHDSLMARLDRLGPAKELAQLGATLGREFSYELLRAVSPLEETPLQNNLAALVHAELLYQRGLPPQTTYIFKHALIQEAAYQSLLKSTRQHYHQQIAQVLEERFPEAKETQPELLAYHYTEAGLKEQAIPCWQQAGERARQRSAHAEAINHLTRGLEVLTTLPDTPERAQQELALQITLGASLVRIRGHAAPDVEHTYARTRALCQQVGDFSQLSRVLFGLWGMYTNLAEHKAAQALGEQLLDLAQQTGNPTALLVAHNALGTTLWWRGELTLAREHLDHALALEASQPHPRASSATAITARVTTYTNAAFALWLLGYPDQALQRSHEALALAQELSHLFRDRKSTRLNSSHLGIS